MSTRRASAATARRASSTTSTSTTRRRTEHGRRQPRAAARPARVGDVRPRTRSPRSSAPRARGSTTSAAAAPSAACRTSTTCCSSARAISRYPLEGYRERCDTDVVLGTRFAKQPLQLDIPITIAGHELRRAVAPTRRRRSAAGATPSGTSTTTGDGGMTPEERLSSKTLVYQLLPSRYGMNPDDLRRADAIEIVVGQGAKPGGGGMLLGQKISERVAEMRDLPAGIDQRSACRHPDWTGPDDLEIKIEELREITDWQKPIFVKVGASRPYYDVAAGGQVRRRRRSCSTACRAAPPPRRTSSSSTSASRSSRAIPQAVEALQELGMHREVQLIVSGGIRSGADVAKALALGADAVSIGVAALVALGDNAPELDAEYAEHRLGGRLLRRLARGPRPGRASPPRTRSSPPGSTPSSAAAGWPTTCARWCSRRRRLPAPAASPTCTTWSPRTWSR